MALPYQETMETLQKMFQGLDRETIATVLLNNEGMIDPSVEQLLKLSEAPIDPLADQKMTIFTVNNPPQEKIENKSQEQHPKPNFEKDVLSQEHEMTLIKQLQEKEDEKIARSLQNHYISKAESEAIQRIYEQDAEEYLDPRILEDGDSDEEDEESESRTNNSNTNNLSHIDRNNNNNNDKKKPLPQEFGPMPKPIKTKKSFKEKLTSFFSRSKKKENVMGKHDAAKLKDQEFGEIISFGDDSQPQIQKNSEQKKQRK